MELRKLERRDALRLLEERGLRSLEFRFGTARHLSVVGEEEIRGGIDRVSEGTDVLARTSADGKLTFRGHAVGLRASSASTSATSASASPSAPSTRRSPRTRTRPRTTTTTTTSRSRRRAATAATATCS
jgi:hypothetical protein